MAEDRWSDLTNWPDNELDAWVTWHKDHVVLIMTHYVARVVAELTGNVTGESQLRKACDKVFYAFEEDIGKIYPEDYVIGGGCHDKRE